MIQLIKNWYKIKKTQLAWKAAICDAISSFLENQQETMELVQNLFSTWKDVPADELQERVMELSKDILAGRQTDAAGD